MQYSSILMESDYMDDFEDFVAMGNNMVVAANHEYLEVFQYDFD